MRFCLRASGIVASADPGPFGCPLVPDDTIPVFLNPAAGRGRAAKRADGILQALGDYGVVANITESRAPGEMEALVRQAAATGASRVLVAGGDGSVHEAVNGLLSTRNHTALGVIPVGTGNDFAKAIRVPLDWHQAAQDLARRIRQETPPFTIDAGRMNQRYFVNGAGIGFDAKINQLAKKYTWPIGDFVYLVAVLEGLIDGVITPAVELEFAGTNRHEPITIANISNGPWVGGMFHIAPMAKVDDGVFDLIVAKKMSRARILRLLPRLIRGTHLDDTLIEHRCVDAFRLRCQTALPSHLDGESQPLQTEFDVRLLRNALSII